MLTFFIMRPCLTQCSAFYISLYKTLYKIFDHKTLISKSLGIANFNVAVAIIIAVFHCLKAVLMQIFKDITFI